MSPFFVSRQSTFPECPDAARPGGFVVDLTALGNFLFWRCAMIEQVDGKLFVADLEGEIIDALGPFRALLSMAHDLGEDMFDFHDIMEIVVENIEGRIAKLFELVETSLGIIRLQGVVCGEFHDFEGTRYGCLTKPKLFKAFVVAAGKGV